MLMLCSYMNTADILYVLKPPQQLNEIRDYLNDSNEGIGKKEKEKKKTDKERVGVEEWI